MAPSESAPDSIPFSKAEEELFQKRYTEGYDLTGDIRYNEWLQVAHPDATIVARLPTVSQGTLVQFQPGMSTFTRPSESVGQLSRFLKHPTPPTRKYTSRAKTSSRVLTSVENLKLIEEKEQEKKAKEAEKEQRRKAAEERKRVRIEKKQQTDLEKAQKAAAKTNEMQQKRKNAYKDSTPAAGV